MRFLKIISSSYESIRALEEVFFFEFSIACLLLEVLWLLSISVLKKSMLALRTREFVWNQTTDSDRT